METMDTIFQRRSIRKYEEREVSDEIIKELLKAAMAAPSANNKQPWEFLVIKNKDQMKEIIEVDPEATPLKGASVAIVVCADTNIYSGKPDIWAQDCAAATQNILLAAHDKGLGAVWIGIYPMEQRTKDVQSVLTLPEEIIPVSIISIGYPAEKKEPANRYNESKVHFYTW